jgi:hypothetical protein
MYNNCKGYSLVSRKEHNLKAFYKNPSDAHDYENPNDNLELTHQYDRLTMTDQSEGNDIQPT